MDLIIGTAGHIDHGKTELIKALTGTDTDRLPEEKKRGITIDLGFAHLEGDGFRLAFIDVPGHEKFVRNMLAGAGGIDAVLLVVAADEGIMPQTREHVDICNLLKIERGVVAVTKCDLVNDRELIEITRSEITELLAKSPLAGAPVFETSSRTHVGIAELRAALLDIGSKFQRQMGPLAARLPIDRSFSVKGFGTVVTGTLISGVINAESELELLPAGRRIRVRGVETFGRKTPVAKAGQRTAINISGVDHREISRGMVLAEPDIISPTNAADARIEILETAPRPLKDRQRLRIHTGTAELIARVRILNEAREIQPGGSGFVRITFETPTALILGQRFIARSYSPQSTIGGGEFVLPQSHRVRRREFDDHCRRLDEILGAKADGRRLFQLLIHQSGTAGMSFRRLAEITGWTRPALSDVVNLLAADGGIVTHGDMYFAARVVATVETAIVSWLTKFHESQPLKSGVAPGEISRDVAFRSVPENLLTLALRRLSDGGKLAIRGDLVSLAGRRATLSQNESAIAESLKSALRNAGLQPPKTAEVLSSVAADPALVKSVFRYLVDGGEIVNVSEDYALDRAVFDSLVERLRRYAETSAGRFIDVSAFKEISGLSRKYAIPILELLDRKGITQRSGDKRLVR